MTIRFATKEDTLHIIRAIQNKKMKYNNSTHVKMDIAKQRLVVIEENGKLLGSCAIVKETEWNYTAIKRVCVYSKKSKGKGIASALIQFVVSLGIKNLGATPWNDNPVMCHIFEKYGFKYQYTFSENYQFYKRN